MRDTKPQIAILLATFNGEQYLREQIDSILCQSYRHWHLYVHDDGSTDGTVGIIHTYAARFPQLITVYQYGRQGGAQRNFLSLLEKTDADYYMFSDQDDVWHPDKIEKSITAMRNTERRHPQKPVVIHSDLRIVDSQRRLLHRSFFHFANIHPDYFKRYEEYVQNVVTGSTMIFNRKAKEAALSRKPTYATMHDSWITLRTIAEGGIRHTIYEPLIDYRQHSGNVVGAQKGKRFTVGYRLRHAPQMLKLNVDHFRMMRSAGNISTSQFLQNKYKLFKFNHTKK